VREKRRAGTSLSRTDTSCRWSKSKAFYAKMHLFIHYVMNMDVKGIVYGKLLFVALLFEEKHYYFSKLSVYLGIHQPLYSSPSTHTSFVQAC